MSSISLRLPDSLHKQARELAERDNISINQLIAMALAEKMAALLAGEYLAERAQRGSRKKFDRALKKVRDGHPIPATSHSVAAIERTLQETNASLIARCARNYYKPCS